ncbi:MAG: VOC family protein [Gammaproteobacteria bacterium]|nr:VOC family protein [Gammaproteobacteria bacterium]
MLDVAKQAGRFSWNELLTSDVAAAKQFYSELFGWQMEDMACGGMDYTTLKINGDEIGGIMKTPKEAGAMPPTWGGYVTVDDVDASVEKVKTLGGKVCLPPQDIPDVGRFCVIQDPQGAMLSLIAYDIKEKG